MKYLLNYEKQENMTTYFFDYAMLCTNKSQYRNVQKVASSPSPRKVTLEWLRTTEA